MTATVQATPIYVGHFVVGEGLDWHQNPEVYSAREAAAYLYGGHYTDYAISTHPTKIDYKAWVDGWGDTQYLYKTADQDFSLGDHYLDNPGRGGAYSAFIADHTAISLKRYNYVWRLHETPVVPEPATILMLGAGSLGAFYLRRRRCRPGAN